MRSVWTVLSAVLFVNILAVGGFAGWLKTSGRLSQDRIERAVDVFRSTIADEAEQLDKAKDDAEMAAAQVRLAAALQRVEDGPRSVEENLTGIQETDEIAEMRAERVSRDIADLRRRFEQDKQLIEKRLKAVEAREKALADALKREKERREDTDFKLAVSMYEKVKARQAKQMFMELIKEERIDDVVEYLAAMQIRQASAVIKEFKESQEIPVATQLIQRLRDRGVTLMRNVNAPA